MEEPISKALSHSLSKKNIKLARFMEIYGNNLEAHLSQLYGFASSTGGLMKDEYRERIWPVLANNLPVAHRYVSEINDKTPPNSICSDEEFSNDKKRDLNISDSDFESALSTFSSARDDSVNEEELGDEDDLTAQDSPTPEFSQEHLRSHKEWNQVELDVARTLARFPPNIEEEEREILQKELTQLIVRILCENEDFRYYQGFHDVCLTFLLVLNTDGAIQATRAICQRGSFHNYLSCTLEESALKEMQNIYVLLFMHDQEVEKWLRSADLGTLFALSWPLTWFSHALQDYQQVVLFFDLFLCSHQLMPIYVSAALISERREEVLRCEADMPMLHQLLNHIPAEMNFNRILDTAQSLFQRYPPSVLSEFQREYLRICDRQRRALAVRQLEQQFQRRIEDDIFQKKKRSSSPMQRYNIYRIAGTSTIAAGVTVLGAVVLYFWRTQNSAF